MRPGWFYHAQEDGQVKSAEKLVDIYYSSVGRNSVLLLNVPPDPRGHIHDNDIRSLRGMRRILEATFRTNLAQDAAVLSSSEQVGHGPKLLLDGDKDTYWTTAAGALSAEIVFDLPGEQTFDRAMLQEYIRAGQRIESFVLEAWDGKKWKSLARGTTIGYKRLLRFPAATAKKVRLMIGQSRSHPALAAFGLYKEPVT